MTQVLDHVPSIQECQERLIAWGFELPKFGADGKGGVETRDAIIAFQFYRGLPRSGQFDPATLGVLFSTPPNAFARDVGLGVLSFALSQVLKGTGINVDFSKISKAIAGGIAGVAATTGTMAVVYLQLPPEAQTHFPSLVYSVLPWVNEGLGFLIGFCGVYFAPANKTGA